MSKNFTYGKNARPEDLIVLNKNYTAVHFCLGADVTAEILKTLPQHIVRLEFASATDTIKSMLGNSLPAHVSEVKLLKAKWKDAGQLRSKLPARVKLFVNSYEYLKEKHHKDQEVAVLPISSVVQPVECITSDTQSSVNSGASSPQAVSPTASTASSSLASSDVTQVSDMTETDCEMWFNQILAFPGLSDIEIPASLSPILRMEELSPMDFDESKVAAEDIIPANGFFCGDEMPIIDDTLFSLDKAYNRNETPTFLAFSSIFHPQLDLDDEKMWRHIYFDAQEKENDGQSIIQDISDQPDAKRPRR